VGDASDPTLPRREHREPLWDRIDRNRFKVGLLVVLFVLAAAVSLALMVAAGGLLFVIVTTSHNPDDAVFAASFPWLTVGGFVLGAGLAVVHVVRMLTRPEERLPGMFGAVPVQRGMLPVTESALFDMAIAAGRPGAPWLWLIDDCERVNAFALGTADERTIVGVTRGFVDRLDVADQRAVFANLMARVRSGDTWGATIISAIMGPIWGLRASQLRQVDELQRDESTWANALTGGLVGGAVREQPDVVVGAFILGFLGVVITELFMSGHERAALAAAEKADAEGMLLLKDPQEMVTALADVLEANNTVPGAGEAYSSLFFCWAGFGYAPEDDPEMKRLGRLREVLGAADVQSA
jgi:Zn-dependent protease with chaperone function